MPAKRAYGMDQDFYPWSPIVTRPILRWPEGARVALAVIVNLEHWDWEVPAGTPVAVSPMGGPAGLWSGNQPQFPDIGGYGNPEYGNRVGILRILAVLDKHGITPTLALDKAVADHYPTLVKEGQRRGACRSRSANAICQNFRSGPLFDVIGNPSGLSDLLVGSAEAGASLGDGARWRSRLRRLGMSAESFGLRRVKQGGHHSGRAR